MVEICPGYFERTEERNLIHPYPYLEDNRNNDLTTIKDISSFFVITLLTLFFKYQIIS